MTQLNFSGNAEVFEAVIKKESLDSWSFLVEQLKTFGATLKFLGGPKNFGHPTVATESCYDQICF
jgi:hypothetical protein